MAGLPGGQMPFWSKQASRNSSAHWSKDFVEHLRTVHFTLVAVAAVLIITVTSPDARRASTALSQAREIDSLIQEFNHIASRPIHHHGSGSIRLPGFSLPVNVPPTVFAEAVKKIDASTIPQELKAISDFRDLWYAVKTRHLVEIDRLNSCSYEVRTASIAGIRLDSGECSVYARDDVENIALNQKYTIEVKPDAMDSVRSVEERFSRGDRDLRNFGYIVIESELPLAKGGRESHITVSKATIRVGFTAVGPEPMSEFYLPLARTDDFDTTFADLLSVSPDVTHKNIKEAIRDIETSGSGKAVSLLGFTIPLPELSRWGSLVLLCIQLYFWLHLHELAGKIKPDAEGWDVAWIGVYRSVPAIIIVFVSCGLLPVAAALTLSYQIWVVTSRHWVAAAYATPIVVVSGVLAFLTLTRFALLRKAAAGATEIASPPASPTADSLTENKEAKAASAE